MKLEELKKEFRELQDRLEILMERSGWEKWEDFDLEDMPEDAEGKYFIEEGRWMMDKLYAVKQELRYLNKPVTKEGFLHKNERGRYELGDYEFTAGGSLEAYVFDEYSEEYRWLHTRIEHDGKDYIIVGYKGSPEAVKVRIRR